MKKFYNFNDICKCVNILDIANSLGINIIDNRSAATWRGGTNTKSVAYTDKTFCDHGDNKKGGNVLKLVQNIKGCDLIEASEWIGETFNLPAVEMQRTDSTNQPIEKEYIYTDRAGNPIHKTIRYEPKDFMQARIENGKWHFGLNTIELVPYNLPVFNKAESIFICEGEKAAEALIAKNLAATTFALGAGNLKDYYAKYFQDKNVVIIPDNDKSGKEHAQDVAKLLSNSAKAIKILNPISDKQKGDAVEFFKYGGTIEKLTAICKKTNLWIPPKQIIEVAREENKTALSNYIITETIDSHGNAKNVKMPLTINEIYKEFQKRLLGYPYIVNDILFDWDRDKKEIYYIRDVSSLFAWIGEKTNQPVIWQNDGDGKVTKSEFLQYIKKNAKQFESISYLPDYPKRDNVFYAPIIMPDATNNHQHFNKLIDFFNPNTEEDKVLLQTLFAAPVYYEYGVPRPGWIIDSVAGQGSGKTTIPHMIAKLYGNNNDIASGGCISVNVNSLKNNIDEVNKRLLSTGASKKKIICFDNITGEFTSPELAELITTDFVTGRPAYGAGELTILNRFTYVLTANSATVEKDIAERCYFIYIGKPKYSADWLSDITNYINEYRLNIVADIIDILKSNKQDNEVSRFGDFDKKILSAFCKSVEQYNSVISHTKIARSNSDYEVERAAEIEEVFEEAVHSMRFNNEIVWITTAARKYILRTGLDFKASVQMINNYIKTGLITKIATEKPAYRNKRGLLWCGDNKESKLNFLENDKTLQININAIDLVDKELTRKTL
jgi:hypothetical protein